MRFTNSLRLEWRLIVSTIKANEEFKNYSLAKMVGNWKSHEVEVLKEAKYFVIASPLVLAMKNESSKKKKAKVVIEDSEFDISNEELTKEDKILMVTNPKKFYKKNFSCFRKITETDMVEMVTNMEAQTPKSQKVMATRKFRRRMRKMKRS